MPEIRILTVEAPEVLHSNGFEAGCSGWALINTTNSQYKLVSYLAIQQWVT